MFSKQEKSRSGQSRQPFFVRYRPVVIPEQGRLFIAMAGFSLFFVIIAMRLVDLGGVQSTATITARVSSVSQVIARPDILDRHGSLLATDVKTAALYANPSEVLDVEDVVDKLMTVLPDLDAKSLTKKLSKKNSKFAWVKRRIPPKDEERILSLGLVGLHFSHEPQRAYPVGNLTSHALGYVDIDNRGQGGIERHIDKIAGVYFPKVNKDDLKPIFEVSIDLGVQHILRQELSKAIKTYRAKAASGIIMDVTSGEVIAMSSLPDFDPHKQKQALEKKRLDRNTNGIFELGSIFKVVTTAMALDTGVANINSVFDASRPIVLGKSRIRDYHGKGRPLNVEEVFIYSSNIGSAKMADRVGIARHKAFLGKLGLLTAMETELGRHQAPMKPQNWTRLSTMTIGFGHGLSVSPLQFVAATASLVNGGYYVTPTFRKRSRADGRAKAKKVLKSATSNEIRQLLRLNVVKGTGRRADAPGYRVGGKTGTAEKAENGRYNTNKLLTSFISVFPSDDPAYVVLVMLDEPQPGPGQKSRPTAGTNAAVVTSNLISQVGSKLGVIPQQKNVALSRK
ncbi:MAG: peptidoglycan D,D-transpeptidase FtsI family protein [Methyloligellaceae bacterium]